jgi:hypothetical protein
LDDVYDEQLIEEEGFYLPNESSETMHMDGCETSMYICGEGDNDPNSQENVFQTRGFVNRPKNKGDSDQEKKKKMKKCQIRR